MSPIPQPKYPGGPKPSATPGQECHLKLRPIWVLGKSKVPDLHSGAYEAAPEGFERVLEKPMPEKNPEHGPTKRYEEIRVTHPHAPVCTKQNADKKSAKKWVQIKTAKGNTVKSSYRE